MNYYGQNNDTICALSTANGMGAIAVIRISGPKAFSICSAIFSKNLEETTSHTALFGRIKTADGIVIDEVLLTVLHEGKSFTGEATVEIACHGSIYIQQQILDPLGLYGGYNVNALDSNLIAKISEFNKETKGFTLSPNAYAPRTEDISNYTMGRSTPIFSPTGGMKISANDLAKYMIMHSQLGKYEGGRMIPKKLSQQMQAIISEEESYGMALENTTQLIAGKTMIGHTGVAYGLYSLMFFEPKEKIGFVVITNGSDPKIINGINGVLHQTVNILYNNLIQKN
jgi:hypothetical protein